MGDTRSNWFGERRDGAPWRITVRRTGDGIGVYNPTRRKIGLVLFMLVWLTGWAAGEYFALSEIMRSGSPLAVDLFLLVLVCAWTLCGGLVLTVLVWQLFGVEKLFLVEGGGVVTERGFGPFTRRRIYAVDRISDIGLATDEARNSANGLLTRGSVRFLADGNPRGFGVELDEEEAELVVGLLRGFVERNSFVPTAGGDEPAPA